VLALGQDLWRLPGRGRDAFRLRHCGFVLQDYCLFPALTARQHLEMMLRWGEGAARRAARRRADEMLALLGLARQARLRPAALSGGEQQRVAVGRALIKQPRLVFADEPTGALDWGHGEQVVELLRGAAHRRGAMVLFVTHDARVAPYADRVFCLEDGRLRQPEGLRGGAGGAAASARALAPNRGR
jgi:putative ABC transport system ATP-binding protein